MKEKYKDLSFKDRVAVWTCLIAFTLGWGMTIAGFLVSPIGEVSDSVLWILGQALIYTASVLGIGMYCGQRIKEGFIDVKKELMKDKDGAGY